MSRVLVVDDEPAMRALFQFILETDGHKVITAESGEEALKALERSPGWYHVVVTDMVMPGMGGAELIRTIRRTEPALKIIAVSGSGEESPLQYLEIARELNVDKALSKPVRVKVLRAAVREVEVAAFG